ncbi:MAG: ATP-binding cassette domain-containing protein [Proteobacteria bacterium]|nr:MAG: ATP-binding cassette domain-containing protein [Pseudomonadota bacterium]
MLQVIGLTKRFKTQVALDNISLTLNPRLTHILLGSSGSGKSTLLRAILGLISGDEGQVLFEGTDVRSMTPDVRAERMGYVPQEGGLFPHFTAYDNVALVAKSRGWDDAKIQARMAELTELVDLDKSLLEKYPRQLSGGQRQRVSIMRATFLNPEVLILDEPLGALDPLIRAELQTELKSIFAKLQKTVVLVTHDLGEAAYLGDSLILMHEGRVVQTGKLVDLVKSPATPFVSKFINAQRTFESSLQ